MKKLLCLILLLISSLAYSGIINNTLTSSTVSTKESSVFDIEYFRKFFTVQDVIMYLSNNKTKIASALISYKKDIIIDSVVLKHTKHSRDGANMTFNIKISKEEVGDGVITTSDKNYNTLKISPFHNVNTVDELDYEIYANGFKTPIFFRFLYDKTILTER